MLSLLNVAKFSTLLSKLLTKLDIAELCKGVHCVDLSESFQTHIFLQHFALIQPRTSPLKFARSDAKPATPQHVTGRLQLRLTWG